VMLWLGVMLILVYNIIFLVVHVMYDDVCTIATEPNALVSYAREAYPKEIKNTLGGFIPASPAKTGAEIFSLDADNILDTVSICMAGSSYSGDKTLVQALGYNKSAVKKMLDDELDKVKNGALDLSGVESKMKGATNDVQTNKGKMAKYKFAPGLLTASSTSCSSCSGFTAFWDKYKAFVGDSNSVYYEQNSQQLDDLSKYGKICDEMCTKTPASQCPQSAPSNAATVAVSGANIQVDGNVFAAPTQLLQALQGGENLCAECRERVCNVSAVLQTVNGQIGKIETALNALNSSLTAKIKSIAPTINSLLDDVSAVLNKGIDNLSNTLGTLKCSVVGDIYNTVLYLPCTAVLAAYSEFAWSFFLRGMFGLLLVVATILLNLYVGLREYEGNENKVLPLDQQTTHVQVDEVVTIDGDGGAVPKSQTTAPASSDASVKAVATETPENSSASEDGKTDTAPVATEDGKTDTAPVTTEDGKKADKATDAMEITAVTDL